MQANRQLSPSAVISVAIILFAVFSFVGWLYETIDNLVAFGGLYLRASFMLPWCPIYGIGGLIVVAVVEPVREALATRAPKALELVLVAIAIYALTAVVELAGSYVCELLMGYVPWDYSQAWLNVDGRIAPAYTLRFVVLGLVALYVVFPYVRGWVIRQPKTAGVVASALVVLFALDSMLQALGVWAPAKDALVPWGLRHW
ncbi:MAG: putative ABC transporter permease [Coriobacteriales bacterium]|nr:putative ABC transporter permease [Coriobacteriales bacterium]